MVTPSSPEAMEEMLWMTFFPHCHDPSGNHMLDGKTTNKAFEQFSGIILEVTCSAWWNSLCRKRQLQCPPAWLFA